MVGSTLIAISFPATTNSDGEMAGASDAETSVEASFPQAASTATIERQQIKKRILRIDFVIVMINDPFFTTSKSI